RLGGRDEAGGDGQDAAPLHRVDRVGEEVHEDLLQLVGDRLHEGKAFLEAEVDGNLPLLGGRAEEVDHVADHAPDVDRAVAGRRDPHRLELAANDAGQAVDLAVDDAEAREDV